MITFNPVVVAEGHSMATRLCRLITTDSKKLRSLLIEYNSVVTPEEQLSWEDVTNLSSSVWLSPLPDDESYLEVPRSVRINAINALARKNRAIEEIDLIKTEMNNVVQFFLQQHALLADAILQRQTLSSNFNRGALCLLKIKQRYYEQEIRACIKFFSKSIELPEVPFPLQTTCVLTEQVSGVKFTGIPHSLSTNYSKSYFDIVEDGLEGSIAVTLPHQPFHGVYL